MSTHWTQMACYNTWANERLYEAVSLLPEGSFHADCGAFFASLCGTLNHVLVADRIWMKRFTGEGDEPLSLDAILFDDLTNLRKARVAEDRRIYEWINGMSPDELAGNVRYRRVSAPDLIEQPLGEALAHLFNHQTHHRGQAHALVTRIGGQQAGPVLDLLAFQRQPR